MRSLPLCLGWIIGLVFATFAHAEVDVPAPLQPWRGWVMQGQEFRACPLAVGRTGATANDFVCAWPGVLALDANPDGARVAQHWHVDAPSWVWLPGDEEHWPQQVTVDGQPAVVTDRNGPKLWLAAGNHEIRAWIPWQQRPQGLRVPLGNGLVTLRVDGKPVVPVQRDGEEIALGRTRAATPEADSLDVRVYRRLADGVPAELDTRIDLIASGQAREEVIGPALPAGFVALALSGEWPARLDEDGRLRIRVQPGSTSLTLKARATAPLTEVVARVPSAPWPKQEIWSYAAAPNLRVTNPGSALQVDPRQAGVPSAWQGLPAFALNDGAKLSIEERSRGMGADDRNRLSLHRQMWLDFDGGGWFARDRVLGEMRQGWRLDAAAPFTLERAEANRPDNNEALLVTRGATAELSGVEWRSPSVNLDAGLRVARASAMPITGWQDSFDRIDTTLHLPYGYRLLGAPGADEATGSWISAWTLLDVFIAAVLALLAWRAFGPVGGLVAIAYLALGYQEPGSPRWILLAVIALVLIVRALPAGRLAVGTEWLRRAALVLLVLVALPFVAGQLRYALYPQLEVDGDIAMVAFTPPPADFAGAPGQLAQHDEAVVEPAPMSVPAAPPPPSAMPESLAKRSKVARPQESITVSGHGISRADVVDHYSQSTVIQTGSGEPDWQLGRSYDLSWSGPVLPAQTVRLLIAPPWLVRLLRIVLVALLAWLIVRLVRSSPPPAAKAARALPVLLAGALGIASFGATRPALAQDFPPDSLLNQLRTQLTAAPKCVPNCATIASASVSARGDQVVVAIEAHAAERLAIPLPFDGKGLSLDHAEVDGTRQDAFANLEDALWIPLDRGVHRIELSFTATADKVSLAFRLPPRRVVFAGEGWEASGLADGRLLTRTLALARARAADATEPAAGAQEFAPFVRVERHLFLNLDWRAHTDVVRMAPKEGGFTTTVPLLAGEHVGTAGVQVANGSAMAAITDGEQQVSWDSSLDKGDTLSLTAPALTDRAEVWHVVVSPTWHVEFEGVPVVAQPAGANVNDFRDFEFHPLPGETLTLKVSRPAPVEGGTRAIDAASLVRDVGQRASESTLTLTLRASQGGEQVVSLPADAEILGIKRDGAALNLRPQQGRLSLPVVPGTQHFEIRFRDGAALGFDASTPPVSLGLPVANITLGVDLPWDRWLLATTGPSVGPAVLYWSELVAMLLVAFALSRFARTPLKLWQWILLGLGFSTFSWLALLVVVAWLFALDWRSRSAPTSANAFNIVQLGLVALTVAALLCVFGSIQQGLLGQPDMHVAGNGSGAHALRWFADRSGDAFPVAHAISLPLWVYKLAMLAWALWLANALVGWLRRGFAAWTQGGYWRNRVKPVVDVPVPPPPAP